MSRIPPAPAEKYVPLVGEDAPLRQQVFAQAPDIAGAYLTFQRALRAKGVLPRRLVELVRLRVSFHNQCRTCASVRYADSIEDGVTEDLVCSLERPQEADDLTEAEKAALAYADKLATDHLSVGDADFARLAEHFEPHELMELCFQIGSFVGFGRMLATLAVTDDLPEEYNDPTGTVAPWVQRPQEFV